MPIDIAYGVAERPEHRVDNFDLNVVGNRVIVDCSRASKLTVQAYKNVAWSTGVLTVRVSNEQRKPGQHINAWVDLAGASTITAAGITATPLDVSGYLWACVEVTTIEAVQIGVYLVAKGCSF